MNQPRRFWVGADPGGALNFGIAVVTSDGGCTSLTVNYVDEAIEAVRSRVGTTLGGVGVDAPLWWSSGPSGLRRADSWIRERYGLHSRHVQAVNSMWGSVLAQGMMFVTRIRDAFPGVSVTETHPKAMLVESLRGKWIEAYQACRPDVTLDSKPDHRRDAIVSAVAAREGFEGRWRRDLTKDPARWQSEQDPSRHWLGPVHYFWPE